MITGIIVFCGAAGALLAFRQFKVLVLVPASLLAAIGACDRGELSRNCNRFYRERFISADWLLGWLHCCGFFMVAKPPEVSELLRVVRTSIGQELQAVFELPRGLPPEMVAVLARLDDGYWAPNPL